MSENNDNSNESNSRGYDSILQAPRLVGATSGNTLIRSGVLRPSVLGPSVLSSTLNNTLASSGAATDAKSKDQVINPFMKDQGDEENEEKMTDGAACVDAAKGDSEKLPDSVEVKSHDDEEEPDDRPDPLSLLRKNGLERANLFAAAKNSIPRVEKSGFVFGQNLHERVTGESTNTERTECASASSELLFSSVIQNAAKSNECDNGAKETDTKSLTDVAREYEESRAQKRKYEEVETFTGEENEVNIVDVSCKLFAFENSNWEERGRGSLRLNDSKNEQECSRVVFRTSGNLRLLLNTKVWAGMVAERPSQKSLRLTAMDNTGKIKIFLVMSRPVDINQLHKALVERIDSRKATHPDECRAAADENHCQESKNGTSAAEHPDEDEDDEVTTQVASTNTETKPDELVEPSPKKAVTAENI